VSESQVNTWLPFPIHPNPQLMHPRPNLDPSPRGFDHLVQVSIVDAEGVIYRQVYSMSFPTPQLVEPLKELVFGEPRSQSSLDYLSNRIRLFCTVYDPATDTYHVDISVFIGTFVGIIVSLIFGRVLFKEWRRSFKAGK
jgi:protein SCO1/2